MRETKARIKANLSVVLFKEDNIHIAYCPAVNVYGYGETDSEAKKSLEVCLSEFFKYTINKNTLTSELEALGWKIKNQSKVRPPEFSTLLSKNSELKAIFDSKPFRKFDKGFAIPLPA